MPTCQHTVQLFKHTTMQKCKRASLQTRKHTNVQRQNMQARKIQTFKRSNIQTYIHYTTIDDNALHCTTLHYLTLPCITLHHFTSYPQYSSSRLNISSKELNQKKKNTRSPWTAPAHVLFQVTINNVMAEKRMASASQKCGCVKVHPKRYLSGNRGKLALGFNAPNSDLKRGWWKNPQKLCDCFFSSWKWCGKNPNFRGTNKYMIYSAIYCQLYWIWFIENVSHLGKSGKILCLKMTIPFFLKLLSPQSEGFFQSSHMFAAPPLRGPPFKWGSEQIFFKCLGYRLPRRRLRGGSISQEPRIRFQNQTYMWTLHLCMCVGPSIRWFQRYFSPRCGWGVLVHTLVDQGTRTWKVHP